MEPVKKRKPNGTRTQAQSDIRDLTEAVVGLRRPMSSAPYKWNS